MSKKYESRNLPEIIKSYKGIRHRSRERYNRIWIYLPWDRLCSSCPCRCSFCRRMNLADQRKQKLKPWNPRFYLNHTDSYLNLLKIKRKEELASWFHSFRFFLWCTGEVSDQHRYIVYVEGNWRDRIVMDYHRDEDSINHGCGDQPLHDGGRQRAVAWRRKRSTNNIVGLFNGLLQLN